MADIAQVGLGVALAYKVGSGSYVPLTTLLDITPPTQEVKIAEWQPLTSPSARQKLAASYNSGDAKFTLVHGAAMMSTLAGLKGANNLTWQITLPDTTTTETFLGIVKEISHPIKVDEVETIEVTMAVSGDLTLAHA